MSRKTPVRRGPCVTCGIVKALRHAGQTQCQTCYQVAWRIRTAGKYDAPDPDPPVCACGRPAHPVYGTCYKCGDGWPELGYASPSPSLAVFPGKLHVIRGE